MQIERLYSHISQEMREPFIRGRRLSDFAKDADISVQLDCKQDGGLVMGADLLSRWKPDRFRGVDRDALVRIDRQSVACAA